MVSLHVTLGQKENIVTKTVEFLVVYQPSTYNAIIDQSLMKKTNMVKTVYYLTIKFSTPTRIGYVGQLGDSQTVPSLITATKW